MTEGAKEKAMEVLERERGRYEDRGATVSMLRLHVADMVGWGLGVLGKATVGRAL